ARGALLAVPVRAQRRGPGEAARAPFVQGAGAGDAPGAHPPAADGDVGRPVGASSAVGGCRDLAGMTKGRDPGRGPALSCALRAVAQALGRLPWLAAEPLRLRRLRPRLLMDVS